MKNLLVYTDGACRGNPGIGAYGFVILTDNTPIQQTNVYPQTTNNRMELEAVINALTFISKKKISFTTITLHSDSKYVIQGVTNWIINWKKNNWKTSAKKDVKNQDLWQQLDTLNNELPIEWIWVKGHANNPYNNLCDQIANEAIDLYNA